MASEADQLKYLESCADNAFMYRSQTLVRIAKENERGFTLPEVLVTILIMGILFSIASASWFDLIESRRVTSATNQLAADLRLAHTSSTNQLATWRVVLIPDQAKPEQGADYLLIKLDSAGNIVASSTVSRTLPDDVKVVKPADNLLDSAALRVLYISTGLVDVAKPSRTLEFTANGSMKTYSPPAAANKDLIEVSVDGNPVGKVRFNEATSRIKIG